MFGMQIENMSVLLGLLCFALQWCFQPVVFCLMKKKKGQKMIKNHTKRVTSLFHKAEQCSLIDSTC